MKVVIVLASLVVACLGAVTPSHEHHYETVSVDAEYVERTKKVLSLLRLVNQQIPEDEYHKTGEEYDIEANIDNYTDKEAVQRFLAIFRHGTIPRHSVFTLFEDRSMKEAIALFEVFYYAKDFETFFKTACFARSHMNAQQFLYAYYIALVNRPDTMNIILPPPYEVLPRLFANSEVFNKIYRLKMENGFYTPELARNGIMKDDDNFVFHANYSDSRTYSHGEQWISYFTEDIGLSSYYYYFNMYFPFWIKNQAFGPTKDFRGEVYFYFLQRLLSRYYLERLGSGLGEIPEFSWYRPIQYGYRPLMHKYYPFLQRGEYYQIPLEGNQKDLEFVETYEQTFMAYLQEVVFKAYNKEIDLEDSRSLNFLDDYWQSRTGLYEKIGGPMTPKRSYEMTARRLLSGSAAIHGHKSMPTAMSFYQTSLRDPVTWQFYSRIVKYFMLSKQYLAPYTRDNLHFEGVIIKDVKVDRLATYFDMFDYNANNALFFSPEQIKTDSKKMSYMIRQPRLNHQDYKITVEVKSDVEATATIKIFIGPKYDSNGNVIPMEHNWANFYELDYFTYNLTKGENVIERSSAETTLFQNDYITFSEIYKLLDQGKAPKHMYQRFEELPKRLMLPRGIPGGYPYQLFVIVYPFKAPSTEIKEFTEYLVDKKTLGYPLDRPLNPIEFMQPNMFFQDVKVYHDGEYMPYALNTPKYFANKNDVPKH